MNIALKAKYSFYSAIVFFLIANPETYKIIQKLFGGLIGDVASAAGCPTVLGLFIHTAIFFFAMLGLMLYPRE